MWLIVGLGNPGSRYAKTRHNIGFIVLDEVAVKAGFLFREKPDFRIYNGSLEGSPIILLEPLAFMNRSGSAVRKVMDKYSLPPENLIVVHDDLDMETGKLKIRKSGSAGGHRGVESIIQHIGSRDFVRLKIGIGRDISVPAEEYVLSKFRKDEIPAIKESVIRAAEAIPFLIAEGVDKAMNRYNRII